MNRIIFPLQNPVAESVSGCTVFFLWPTHWIFTNEYKVFMVLSMGFMTSNIRMNMNYSGGLERSRLYFIGSSVTAFAWKDSDKQCTYNVTMTHFHETIAVVKRNKYYIFVCLCVYVCVRAWVWVQGAVMCLRACSLTNPAWNAPPYCHLRSLCLCLMFRHYLINGTTFAQSYPI